MLCENIIIKEERGCMKDIESYLPVFPGFAYTIFDPSDNLSEHEDVMREDGQLKEGQEIEFDYNQYCQGVAINFMNIIQTRLVDLGFISSIEEPRVSSPKEYNYHNDEIDCKYLGVNLDKILEYLKEEDDDEYSFENYLYDHYTSRDGFMSNYSNDIEDWINSVEEWKDGESSVVDEEHGLGAIFESILEDMSESIKDQVASEIDVSDYLL